MSRKNVYLDFVTSWMAPLGEITARPMFGGYCLYCDGVVFALIADDVLYLKADGTNRPEFESRGIQPFRPFADKPETMSYYAPPADFFDNEDEMRRWAAGAIEAGRRTMSKKKARRQASR